MSIEKSFSLASLSIKRPVLAWMGMVSLVLFGGLSLLRLGVSQLPDVDFPVLNLSIRLPGAEPTLLESSVVEPVEDGLIGTEHLKRLSVTSSQDTAQFTLEFEFGTDLNLALQDVQNRAGLLVRRLPKNIDPIRVSKTNPEDQPVMWLSLKARKNSTITRSQLMALYRDRIQDRIKQVDGVGDLMLVGYQRPAFLMMPKLEALIRNDLAPSDLANAITTRLNTSPLGQIDHKNFNLPLRLYQPMPTSKDLENTYIQKRSGAALFRPIQLKEVATLEDSLEPTLKLAYRDEDPAVVVGVQKRRGSNAVKVADLIEKEVAQITAGLKQSVGADVEFEVAANETDFIKASLKEMNHALLYAVLFTGLLCWGFLGSKLATFNILLSIPTSIVGTFIMLYACGFTLNLFTLLGLSLAIGIVVDDSILVLENIARHRKLGLSAKDAALKGTEEIQFSALASSLSIVAIFIPILFMKTIVGRFLFEFGVTMSTAILLSYIESMTLAPMRAASMPALGKSGPLDRWIEALRPGYEASLRSMFKHRWKVLSGVLILTIANMWAFKKLKFELTPEEDRGRIMLRLVAPPGTRLSMTEKYLKEVYQYSRQIPEVSHALIYSGGFGGNDTSRGVLMLSLTDQKIRKKKAWTVAEEIQEHFKKRPEFKLTVRNLSLSMMGGGRGYAVEVKAQGLRWNDLKTAQDQILSEFNTHPQLKDIEGTLDSERPELRLVPDAKAALTSFVDLSRIQEELSLLYSTSEVTTLLTETVSKPILMLLPWDSQLYQSLVKLRIRNQTGEWVPLSQVTKLTEDSAPKSLVREGRLRTISVFANISKALSSTSISPRALENQIIERVKNKLPEGITLSSGSSSQDTQDSGKELLFAFLLGILVSYMILASQFNNYLEPLLVLSLLPLALLGALGALFVFGGTLNVYSGIGILLLMGIVKKNSILVLDFARELRSQGLSVRESLIQASSLRLRPILMTTLSTLAGALPTLLQGGAGQEARAPMALVVIGGLALSTPIGLYVVALIRGVRGETTS